MRFPPTTQIKFSPVVWVTIEKVTQQSLWLLLFFILAPLLGPKPYGLFAIVMVFVAFFEMAIVGAAIEALVTIPDLDANHLRTVNLCNTVVAILGGAVIFGSANILAEWFGSTELGPMFRMLAPLPLISALTSTPIALLSRQLRFDSLALRSIIGLVIGGVFGVGFAVSGAGVQSLVAQVLAQRATELVVLWASAHTRFGLGWSRAHFNELRGYAANVLVSRGMSWTASQVPRSILGWYLGPADLGLFVLAVRLIDIVIQVAIVPRSSVARVMLRLFSEDPAAMTAGFNKVVRETAILSFPICLGFVSTMPTLFATFLDSRWQPGVVAAQMMGLTVIPLTFYYCSTAVLMAGRQLHLDSWSSVALTAGLLLTVLIVGPYGIKLVSGALVLQAAAFVPIPLIMLRRVCGSVPFIVVWRQLPLLGAAAVMGLAVKIVAPFIDLKIGHMATIPVLIAIGVAIYLPLAALAAPDDTRRLMQRMVSMVHWAIGPGI